MRVKDQFGQEVTIVRAIKWELDSDTDGGELERMRGKIEKLQEVLAKFMALHITSVDDLNEILCGYDKYDEVIEE